MSAPPSTSGPLKKKRNKKNLLLWKYFEEIPNDPELVRCLLCLPAETIISRTTGKTTGMSDHLKTHPEEFKAYEAAREKAEEGSQISAAMHNLLDVVGRENQELKRRMDKYGVPYSDLDGEEEDESDGEDKSAETKRIKLWETFESENNKHHVTISSLLIQKDVVRNYIHKVIGEAGLNDNVIIGFSAESVEILAPIIDGISNPRASQVYFFPVDERRVNISDSRSTAGKLIKSLRNFPHDHILQVSDESTDADGGLQEALSALEPKFKKKARNWLPIFDLIFLGHGLDARLVSQKSSEWILEEQGRIALTIDVLNAAKRVAFIANGTGKAESIRAIIKDQDINYLPNKIGVRIEWFMDEEAASGLKDY